MKKDAGLWIDHRKAVIMTVTDGVEEIKQIPSDVEKHVRFHGGSHSGAPEGQQGGSAEDAQDRRFTSYLNRYYDNVISAIRHAESVLIFGPGEAKGEIERRLKNTNFIGRIYSLEAADKMTDRQISAKIRRHVLNSGQPSRNDRKTGNVRRGRAIKSVASKKERHERRQESHSSP